MKRAAMAVGVAVLAIGSASTGHAQQQIQWKQVYNMPKGANQPKGISLDILGIELGDTYAEAKAKLEKLAAEYAAPPKPQAPPQAVNPSSLAQMDAAMLGTMDGLNRREQDMLSGVSNRPPLSEQKTIIRYQTPGGIISAEYVGQITMRREIPNGNAKISEIIDVHFSAPSSGAQVFAVKRDLSYNNGEQAPVAQVVQILKDKMRAEAQMVEVTKNVYRYQYDGGRLVAFNPPTPRGECTALFVGTQTRSALKNVNANGVCDIMFETNFTFGISTNHARRIEFFLSDQERAKNNKEADYAYVESYIRDLQSQSKGTAPKL